jgi:hypothetical protein
MINHFIFIFGGLFLLIYILAKVKKKYFAEKESLIWILAGLGVLILALFPELLGIITSLMGVAYAPTALFLLTFFAIVFILLRKEEQITKLNDKTKELAQMIALLEKKLRENGR